ncbi:cellulase family glycosylhydrolase [Streptomyces sp. ME18-1-4]|uniref:cellulase family glycosylhydrolase n=1 Tax=Streptomyces sp. ME18-1-4 TaxID=3028685 RepID=UPI0039F68FDF
MGRCHPGPYRLRGRRPGHHSPGGRHLATTAVHPRPLHRRRPGPGRRFRLKSANRDGAQGSWTGNGDAADPADHHAGQNSYGISLGLDRAPLPALLADFHALGINSVRLPFSNEMIHATAPVPDAAVTADPQLRGRRPLQIYDAVVAALTHEGFAVVLNNHTNTSRWSCGVDGKRCSPCGCGRAATGTREPPRPPAPTACG